MLTPSPIAIHDIKDVSTLPKAIGLIARQFLTPLTSNLHHVTPEGLCPPVWALFQEAMESNHLKFSEENCIKEKVTVVNLLDTILSSVRMLRDLSNKESSKLSRDTTCIWSSLISILALATYKDAVSLTDIRFLLSRTTPPNNLGSNTITVEGKALLIVCTMVVAAKRTSGKMDIGDYEASSITEGNSGSGDSEASFDNHNALGSSFTLSDISLNDYNALVLSPALSDSSFESLDAPLDSYLLPGRGRRTHCILPIICVGDENNIQQLVISAAYQRACWGIHLPVIGITLSKTGTTAKIIIGWINEGDLSNVVHDLPCVHLTQATHNNNDPSSGIFSLINPSDALQFSQFILSINSQFTAISTSLASSPLRDFCWRSDHAFQGSPVHNAHVILSEKRQDMVEAWLREAAASGSPGYNLSSMSRGTPEPTLLKLASEVTESPGGANLRKKSNPPSRYSASEFAAAQMKKGCDLWLDERRAIGIARIKTKSSVHTSTSAIEEQINDMVVLYDDLFVISWPDKWRKPNHIPQPDSIYKPVRELLFSQYEKYVQALQQSSHTLEENDSAFLTLKSRFSTLFEAIEIARGHAQQEIKGAAIDEAEYRRPWDFLLCAFGCFSDKPVSDYVFMEKEIHLSKNQAAAQGLNFPKFDQAELSVHITRNQHDVAVATDGLTSTETDAAMYLRKAYAESKRSALTHLRRTNSYSPITPESRRYEPGIAKIDSVLCAPVLVPFSDSDAYSSKPCPKLGSISDADGPDSQSTAALKSVILAEPLQEAQYQQGNYLYLPYFYGEYKRKHEDMRKAGHQAQMCCVSTVDFLATLDIMDFPVFALVTAGIRGSIIMVWKSSKDMEYSLPGSDSKRRTNGYNFIMDQNLISFDISQPFEAYRFAITIHRIFKRREELLNRLKGKDLGSLLEGKLFKEWMTPSVEKKVKPPGSAP